MNPWTNVNYSIYISRDSTQPLGRLRTHTLCTLPFVMAGTWPVTKALNKPLVTGPVIRSDKIRVSVTCDQSGYPSMYCVKGHPICADLQIWRAHAIVYRWRFDNIKFGSSAYVNYSGQPVTYLEAVPEPPLVRLENNCENGCPKARGLRCSIHTYFYHDSRPELRTTRVTNIQRARCCLSTIHQTAATSGPLIAG